MASGGAFGAFLGGLGGGAVGSAVVKLYLDASQYQSGMTQAKTQTESSAAQMSGTASMFSKAWVIGGAVAATAIGQFAVSSVKAAIESQEAQDKLKNSIENTGHAADFSVEAFNNQAAALRDTTGASDEAINGVQGLLVQMGYTQDQVIQLTPYINDLSAKMGIDLASAAKAVGKAAEGSTGALARYLGPIEEGTNKAGTYANVLEKLAGVQGYAAQQAKVEPWKILSEQFNEFQEQIGLALLPALQKMTDALTPIAQDVLPKLADAIASVLVPIGDFAQALDDITNLKMPNFLDTSAALLKVMSFFDPAYKTAADNAKALADAQDAANKSMEQGTTAAGDVTNTVSTYGPEVKAAASNLYRWGSNLIYTNGLMRTSTSTIDDNTGSVKDNNRAMQEAINLRWKVAGGILGVVGAYRQLKQDQAEVNRLERQGKENTAAYREAVSQLIGDQIDYRQQIQGVRQDLRQGNITVAEAKKQLEDFGRQAGLSKDHVRAFLEGAIGPFIDKMRAATSATNDLTGAINAIPRNRNISITVHTRYTGQAQPV